MKIKCKPGVLFSSCWQNFPLSLILCCLLAVFYGISDTFLQNVLSPHPLVGVIPSALWVGLGGCTAVSCLKRRCALPRWTPVVAAVTGIAVGGYYAQNASVVWGLMIVSVALCLYGLMQKEDAPLRLEKVINWFFISLGFSIILYIALSVCVTVFFSLLLSDAAYKARYLWGNMVVYFSFLLFAPCVFLGGLPAKDVLQAAKGRLRRMACLVFLPVYIVLLSVLLLYVLKILLTWTMPEGVMNGYAILALTVFAAFHLLLTGEEGKLARWFGSYGGWLLVPIIAAQGVGIFIRAAAYGLTANRILGIIWSLLCVAVVVCALFRRYAHWFFPAVAVFALIFLCSPLSAENLARMQQERRLLAALERNGMLDAQENMVANAQTQVEDRAIIYSAVEYLEGVDAPSGTLSARLQAQLTALAEENDYPAYSAGAKEDLLGFKKPQREQSMLYSLYYRMHGSAEKYALDTRGMVYAELMTLSMDADKEEHAPARYMDCDLPVLFAFLEEVRFKDVAPERVPALTLHIDGETVELSQVLEGVRFVEGEADLPLDVLTLPSGKQLRIVDMTAYDHRYQEDRQYSLSLSAWLLTPESE